MLNDHDIAVLGMVASAVLFAGNIIFVTLWVRARERALRNKADAGQRAALPADDARGDRLEQAIDAVAIEVERISEGQRFVAKLLTERASASVP